MIKRLFDFLCSSIGLILFAPVLLLIALMIKSDSRGPVFYRGRRVGLLGRIFHIYKFRTMVPNAESIGASSTADNDVRITRVGGWLRRWKLDELPQLINVWDGTMSLVGPRPQVEWMVARYSPAERCILSVRPGITDYASICFHNEGEILRHSADPDQTYLEVIHPKKMALAIEYTRSRSFWLDCKILVQTLFVMLAGLWPGFRGNKALGGTQ